MRASDRKLVQYPVLLLFYGETLARCLFQFDSKTSRIGNFSSPDFPAKYSANTECFYNFAGHDFETLKLTFFFFDLEPPYAKGCLTDYVDISTITAANVKELVGRYCGSKIDTPLLSMHPKAEIIFRSNHIIHHKGFFGQYEFKDEMSIPPPKSTDLIQGCGGTQTGVGGTIVSPGYPDSFPKDVECVWLVRVDTSKHIYVRILDLQLYGSIANCADAELSIYDGYSSFSFNPEIMKKFCGDLKYYKNVEERTQMSKRNRLLIRFKTKVTSEKKGENEDKVIGFKLVWTAVAFEYHGKCDQHVCRDSHYCLNTASSVCNIMPQYCVHKSLVCDGMPNCSEDDYSDEEKCHLPLVAGCGGAVIILLISACSIYYIYRNKRKKYDREALAIQLRQLEHSPSSMVRGPRYFTQSSDCSIHGHLAEFSDDSFDTSYKSYPTVV
ncbi:tolloid-like protein 1 [Uloborus diversus]|uniref:tolloid-like protein 1 n=1 Tax=Uloborus diversus TaxID=327109 RepID=UPI0024093AFF|nr:tolloid-like protein 1 [Uloborus diversus]